MSNLAIGNVILNLYYTDRRFLGPENVQVSRQVKAEGKGHIKTSTGAQLVLC